MLFLVAVCMKWTLLPTLKESNFYKNMKQHIILKSSWKLSNDLLIDRWMINVIWSTVFKIKRHWSIITAVGQSQRCFTRRSCISWFFLWQHLFWWYVKPIFIIRLSTQGKVYSIQHYVIKFVSDLQQGFGFLQVFRFPPPIKLIATI